MTWNTDDLLSVYERAWVTIANAANWGSDMDTEWIEAAESFRDDYHKKLHERVN